MSEIDYQALREIAKQATQSEWVAFISPGTGTYAVHTPGDKRCEDVIKWTGFDGQKNAENNARYIAAFNPEVVQALLDERESQNKRIAELEKSEEQLINERDHAESALDDMYFAATGNRPEWSNWFGFSDAVDAVVDRIADLEAKQPSPVVPEADPVAWTDEEELRDVKQYGLGEIFQYPPDKYADSRRVIPLYRVPPASIVQAQGIEIAINELVALSPRLDKQAVETLSMAVAQLRKLVKKQLQAKE
ncbi:ead/Ea22-like family protein [Escherichia coli]|nr:ead/Ea22-like family protein [Escherichia coli]MMK49141.1 ead/Ea22-like family protein [Escherichia coli]